MTETEFQAAISALLPDTVPVLVVDDDPSVIDVTRLVLSRYRFEQRPVEVLQARSAKEGQRILAERPDIAVAFLDVVMEEDDAGLKLVEFIRNELSNQKIRIILRTGQAGFAPEYRVVQNYDINDYLAKSESTQERLYVSLTAALRGYRDILASEFFASRVAAAEHQRRLTEQALEEKSRFLAHLSHEIRNPLTGMVGIVELLEDAESTERAELLDSLDFTVQTLLGVVDDVLDVAKIEAGKFRLQEAAFNIRHWLKRTASTYAATLRQKGIHLSYDVAEDLPESLIGDQTRLRQVLSNFLSNAARFTPVGGQVTIKLTGTQTDDQLMFFLAVSDTGVGIASDRLTSVFNPYEQEDAQTSEVYGGTGLGLSLCRNLAELMKGSVGVTSRQGKGSTFWLEVPLKVDNPIGSESGSQNGKRPGQPLTILVCEDDATNQRTLRVILEKKGVAVKAFDHGRALVDSEEWRRADAVIMDCHMPELDGMAAARILRDQGCVCPILALTAGVTDSERHECLEAGMDCVISKPVDYAMLYDQVLALVHKGRHPVRIA
ncbi:response regulator [Thalassolituus sp.]|uniref:ATP-binding response regulator n=1 Tax=Thalassolituus sp. TaxID=2030822 RepID=UPI0035136DC7